MKKVYSVVFLLIQANLIFASILNYSFTAFSGVYTPNTAAATSVTEIYCGADDELSRPYSIGFNFTFGGTTYTQFEVSSNGWITFNLYPFLLNNAQSDAVNNLTSDLTMRPGIAPLWDDLAFNSCPPAPGQASVQTSGLSPNRTCTIEWTQAYWKITGGAPGEISFQIILYETTNVIDFVYHQETGTISAGASASIGLAGPTSGDYYSLPNTGAAPVPSKVVETTSLNTKPATGQVYRWTPVSGLPIKLESFNAQNIGAQNTIEWVTATETNNNYFSVERCNDGIKFEPILNVKGAGNSTIPLNYQAYDDSPYPGINYYRLKQTDFDGNYSYSDIVPVLVSTEKDLVIFPNPVNTSINVAYNSTAATTATLKVIDITGKVISSSIYNINNGSNNLQMNAQDIAPGIYILQANFANGSTFYKKFMKE